MTGAAAAAVVPQEPSAARAGQAIAALREFASRRHDGLLADERRSFHPGAVQELGRLGLFGLRAPRAAGGLALGALDSLRVLEQLGAIDASLATLVGLHNLLGLGPVLDDARQELREEFVPLLASGRGVAAFAFAQPAGRSAVEASETAPGRWLLQGRVPWVTSASGACLTHVFAQAGPGHELQGFAVPQGRRGLRCGPERLTLGLRALSHCELQLDGVAVEEGLLLGAPGAGLAVARRAEHQSWLGLAALCTGAMKRALRLALAAGGGRGGARGRFQAAARERLADAGSAIAALEALWTGLAARLDGGAPVPAEAYLVCKVAGSELAWEVVDAAVQLAGARGYLETEELPRLLRDVRAFRLGDRRSEWACDQLGAPEALASLSRHLREELGAADLAGLLAASGPAPEAPGSPGRLRLGALAAAATLVAVTRGDSGNYGEPGPAGQRRTASWARERFESRRAALAAARSAAAELTPSALEEWLAEVGGGVGELSAGGPGAIWTPDRWLRAAELSAQGPRPDERPADGLSPEAARLRDLLRSWLAERLEVPAASIEGGAPLTQLGLDSVLAIELAWLLQRELGRPVDASVVWAFPTLDGLARGLVLAPLAPPAATASPGPVPQRLGLELRPLPASDSGPLSFCELGLFRLISLDPRQAPYNLFVPLRLAGPPDAERLRRALALLVARHQSLRTGFALQGGRPARRIAASAAFPLEVQVLAAGSEEEREAAIRAAFDALRHHRFELDQPPLARATLLQAEGEGFLALSFNHLIVDAWSLGLIHRELAACWRALGRGEEPALAPLQLQPSDYAAASDQLFGPVFARGREAFPPWPEAGYRLPLDAPMPAAPSHVGTFFRGLIDGDLWTRAKAAAASADMPAAAAVLAAFQFALHRHARRGDVAFTVVSGNRRQAELQPVVASLMYGETFEGTLAAGDTWAALLQRTRPVVIEQRRERMPYNMIVQPPSMRVVFNFHNFAAAAGEDTAPFEYLHENRYPYLWAVWDLIVQLLPVGDGLFCELLYRSEVLREETIAAIFATMLEALEALAADPFAPAG